jgi:hypothetical protein
MLMPIGALATLADGYLTAADAAVVDVEESMESLEERRNPALDRDGNRGHGGYLPVRSITS